MPAHTRTKAQVQSDRIAITKLYLEGKYQQEIADTLGVSQEQVSYDLRAVQKQWRDIPVAELNELKAKELAKIDHLERTYWEAYEDSKKPKEITNTAKEGDRLKVGKRSEQRNGNPQYLAGVQWCITTRCKILGLDAIRNDEVSDRASQAVMIYLPDNDRDTRN